MNPKVSMLVPAFKDSYLSQSINSLLSQTYDNFSITVVVMMLRLIISRVLSSHLAQTSLNIIEILKISEAII